jgi:hypothetical protein
MAILETIELGPGELTIGTTGSEIDASCLINNAKITTSKSTTDPRTMLCGDVKPGTTTYTYALSGNLDTDIDDPAGLFALSQSAPGSQQTFTFTPNTATGTEAAGTLTLDPLDFGGDDSGGPLQSDFEFDLVEAPTYTYPTVP